MDMEIFFPGGKRVDALYNGLTIPTDQPSNGGGKGSAPSPFDLFLASIGTCVGYYVLSFCQERNIPTAGIRLTLRPHRNSENGMIDWIAIDLALPPGFPRKYRAAVKRAAELCAVKKHLETPPRFDLQVRTGESNESQAG